jgi:hypothetical protein
LILDKNFSQAAKNFHELLGICSSFSNISGIFGKNKEYFKNISNDSGIFRKFEKISGIFQEYLNI